MNGLVYITKEEIILALLIISAREAPSHYSKGSATREFHDKGLGLREGTSESPSPPAGPTDTSPQAQNVSTPCVP